MLKPVIGGYGTPKFRRENFCGWLQNCEFVNIFSFKSLRYTVYYYTVASNPGLPMFFNVEDYWVQSYMYKCMYRVYPNEMQAKKLHF